MTVFNRDQIESRLIKRIEDYERGYRQNVALIGGSGVGKTRTLIHFLDSLKARAGLMPVYLPLKDIAPAHLHSFWISKILNAAFDSAETDLDCLLNSCESNLPQTTKAARHILKLLKNGNSPMATRELFALSGQLAEESGRKAVLVLDEFLGLEKMGIQDVYSIFGSRLMMEKEVLFIVSSSEPRRAREIFSEKLALLFNNFEIIEMQPFDFQEMSRSIDKRVCGTHLSLPARRFLFRLTSGEPRYLDTILQALDDFVCLDPRRPLGVAALFEAVIREVLEENGRIALEFQKKIASFRRSGRERESIFIEAAAAFGTAGRLKPGQLASMTGIKVTESKKLMQRMHAENWLVMNGISGTLRDPLFRFWAREYLAPLCHGRLANGLARRVKWTRKLGELYEIGLESDSNRLVSRLESLLKHFKSESINLLGRRVPGAVFSDCAGMTLADNEFVVKAQSSKDTRLFLMTMDEIAESTIERFLALTGTPKKPLRRVVIAVAGIEQNARLLAQQSRIEIWDGDFFNALLDFFGLPKVIVEKPMTIWGHTTTSEGLPLLFSGHAS